ncbi:class I SAM-dependent methyltransferase [Mesoterricola silvestris]|uniref:Methyltransferase domain-containing protein n=1 Tax=Mesoterricola silvestris TaxID=2927979 RepID=A0AA48KBI1_9BACT|nr:methyltransferase domain-containing protein [Mesoterricola silvestris]BDU72548.1 hypothetical protein METEAL_17220 [Mesoterricola silvestris]
MRLHVLTLLSCLAVPGPAAPVQDPLPARLEEARKAADPARALALAEALNEQVEPIHVESLFLLASAYARLGNRPKAYEWLQRAVDAGFWDVDAIREGEAFKAFRGEPRLKALARQAWAKGYLSMLERKERAAFQKPERILASLAFRPGERVADVGAGSGYFTVPVARAVGPTGSVLAVDILQDMLDYVERRAQAEQLTNIKLLRSRADDPMLPAAGADTILLVDVLHYVKERTPFAVKLKAGLAPGGRIVVIDYIPKPMSERPWGPSVDQQFSRDTMDREMAAAGLKRVQAFDYLPEQWFAVYGAE